MSDALAAWGPLATGLLLGALAFFTPFGFAVGFFVGSLAGSLLFRPDTPTIEGPSLQDRRVQKSEYGAHLPVVWGRMRTAGNIVWVKGNQLDESIRKVEQGGQKIRMREYSATFLVLAAETPDGVGIDGIEKIWLNHELVYDFAEQQVQDPATGEMVTKFAATKKPGVTFRVLDGTQISADDLITADLGDVPAYTGRAGVLFINLPVADYGNAIPTVEMLVVRKCGTSYPPTVDFAGAGEGSHSAVDVNTGLLWYISDFTVPCEVTVLDPVSETIVAVINLGLVNQPIWDGENAAGIGIDYATKQAVVSCYPGWEGVTGTVQIDIDLETYQITFRGISPTVPASHPILNRSSGFYSQFHQRTYLVGGATITGFIVESDTLEVIATGPAQFFYAQELARWQDIDGKIYPTPVWWAGESENNVPAVYEGKHRYAVSMTNAVRILDGQFNHLADFAADEWTEQGIPKWAWDHERNYLYTWDAFNVGNFFYRLDLNNDAITATKIDLDHACNGLGYDSANDLLLVGSADGIWVYNPSDMSLVASRADINASGELYAPPNAAGWFIRKATMDKIYYQTAPGEDGPLLSTVVGDVLLSIPEFSAEDFDVSALTQRVKGYASGQSPRGTIDPLRQLYRFDLVEVDHLLKAVNRGGAPVAVIEWDELGASTGKAASAVTVTRRQEVELAKQMTLTLMDPALDYQDSTQRATKIQTTSDHHVDVRLPIVMSADEAAQAVEVLLHQDWLARTGYAVELPPKYAWLCPSDVVSIPQDPSAANHYTMLCGEMALSPEVVVSLKGVREQSDIYTSTAAGAVTPYTPPAVVIPYPSRLELLDINPWNGALTGYYLAVSATRQPWPGADVVESSASSGPFDAIAMVTTGAAVGSAVTALADASPWRTDYTNSVTVRLADPSALLASGLALLGNEIIHFSVAVQSGQEWTLSTLLRGRKGTDTQTAGHAIGERFVLLDANVVSVAQPVAEVDVDHYFKAVTRGQRETHVAPVTFANSFNVLKPWSPKQAAAAIGSDTVLTWQRSDRLTTDWYLSRALPLSEETEDYEVDILDAGGEVIRTATGITSATWTYTAAMQATDSAAGVSAVIYQISAAVGRGYPATVAI